MAGHGIELLHVNFLADTNVVEITYMERREQTAKAGVLRTVAFDTSEWPTEMAELKQLLEELTDGVLEQIRLDNNS